MAMILSDLEILEAHFCQLAQMPFGLKEILIHYTAVDGAQIYSWLPA